MFVLPYILAAGSLITLTSGAPVASSSHYSKRATANVYTVYGGNGDVSDGWPSGTSWIASFDTMFNDNTDTMKASCTQFGAENNSDDEISDLKDAIQEVATSSGVDSRFILAIMMQESNGCVRAPTTVYSISNPGLMQSHEGTGSCNSGTSVQNPCPKSEMVQMLNDGTAGTSSGDGLKQLLAKTGVDDVSKYYKAARMYNSGSIASDGNLGGGVATHCYATDIANRLTGWYSGTSACDANTIATLTGTGTSVGSSSAVSVATSAATSYVASSTSVYIPPVSSIVSVASSALSVATSAASIVVMPFYTESAAAPSSTASSTTQIGGVFAQSPASSSSSVVAAPSVTVASSAAIAPAAATSEVSAPVYVPTSSSIPVLPTTTGTAPAVPTSTSTSSSNSTAYAEGTPCDSPGLWNCVNGNSFQRCSSSAWSAMGQLSAGTACTPGESDIIDIFATSTSTKAKPRSVRTVVERRGGKFASRAVPIAL